MTFKLELVTKVSVTNANPRRELHGEDKVRAIDLSFSLTGENTLLDSIETGLREHHYFNKALKEGQEILPGVEAALCRHGLPSVGTVRTSWQSESTAH